MRKGQWSRSKIRGKNLLSKGIKREVINRVGKSRVIRLRRTKWGTHRISIKGSSSSHH